MKYQFDLCPLQVNSTEIIAHRRQLMTSSMYQKLQNVDVIPMDFTSISNIVNHFADHNDGYAVLYAMLELVHPVLQWDAVILPPYSAREQVNHFV